MNKGGLQNLRQSTATFSGMVAAFLKANYNYFQREWGVPLVTGMARRTAMNKFVHPSPPCTQDLVLIFFIMPLSSACLRLHRSIYLNSVVCQNCQEAWRACKRHGGPAYCLLLGFVLSRPNSQIHTCCVCCVLLRFDLRAQELGWTVFLMLVKGYIPKLSLGVSNQLLPLMQVFGGKLDCSDPCSPVEPYCGNQSAVGNAAVVLMSPHSLLVACDCGVSTALALWNRLRLKKFRRSH